MSELRSAGDEVTARRQVVTEVACGVTRADRTPVWAPAELQKP